MKATMFFHVGNWKWILVDAEGKTRADFLPDCPWVSWLFGNPKKGKLNHITLHPSIVTLIEDLPREMFEQFNTDDHVGHDTSVNDILMRDIQKEE